MLPSALGLHEVAALDVLADIVGDCEALRLLGVTEVTASPLAIGTGRIRTSHGDLSVPVPPVADLIDGWRLFDVTGEAAAPVNAAAHALSGGTRYLPVGGVVAEQGVLTEGPAQVVGGVGELATPAGTAIRHERLPSPASLLLPATLPAAREPAAAPTSGPLAELPDGAAKEHLQV